MAERAEKVYSRSTEAKERKRKAPQPAVPVVIIDLEDDKDMHVGNPGAGTALQPPPIPAAAAPVIVDNNNKNKSKVDRGVEEGKGKLPFQANDIVNGINIVNAKMEELLAVPVISHLGSPFCALNRQADLDDYVVFPRRQSLNDESSSSGGSEVVDSTDVLKRPKFDLNLPPPDSPEWSSSL
ncbi:hypothetical protein H6P81_001172 [Aristolochia fimbriata]|uniref:Uncharacterized protein n=1 Tax=Aristolochia fimbriata TaxID=158543 RepID=A0AAV7F7M5_ARIFI|nr:hypothetical protein H6P81_001172 [Aristolochia fimbriata]